MKKEILIAAVLVGVAGTAVSADDFGRRGGEGGPAPLNIEMLDTDGDGALSLAEIQAAPEARFAAADADGDGSLSLEELTAMVEAQIAERAVRGAEHMLDRLDANEDGVLTADELQPRGGDRIERMFERLDADEDGILTAEELEAAKERMEDRRPSFGKRH